MPDEFEKAERGLRGELLAAMPEEVKKALEGNIQLVQDIVVLGTILDVFVLEDGKSALWSSVHQGLV